MRIRSSCIAILGAAWLTLSTVASLHAQAGPPRRIASFNLCADQLVLALADPDQIAGLSIYATDPEASLMVEEARAFPRLPPRAEATIVLAPDLVLVGPIDRPATRRMIAAEGVRISQVDLVTDLDAARTQVMEVAKLLGHPERGANLIGRIDAARARLAAAPHPAAATALILERGGYVAGSASLASALLAAAGFRPPTGAPRGYGGLVTLEALVVLRPDFIVLDDPTIGAIDQGATFLAHPALRKLYPPERRIALPHRYTLCGGPALIAAYDYMTEVVTRLAARP